MNKGLTPWRKKKQDTAVARATDDPINELHRQMNDLFDDFFEGFGATRWPVLDRSSNQYVFAPSVDVSETDDEITVSADLPGMDEKDIQVTLDNDVLTIRGEKKVEHEEKKRNYHMVERSYGEFHRAIPMPQGIDAEKVKAKFAKGVLTVSVAKKPEAQSREKRIEITSG